MKPTDNQIRLKRAKDALGIYRDAEIEARKRLADAVESTRRAKEKYEELFAAEERAEVERRKSDYCHATF